MLPQWFLIPYNFPDLDYMLYCYSITEAFRLRESEVELVEYTDDEPSLDADLYSYWF